MSKKLFKKISSQKILSAITLVCAAILGVAYILEHFFAVLPCQMCLYERDIFMGAGGLSLLSLILVPSRFQRYAIIGLGFIFLGAALFAFYHVAIQYHWVSLPSFCAANNFESLNSVEALREQLLKTPLVRCDQVTWSLFGLSLAAYNAILSLFLALMCWKWLRAHP